MVIALVVTPEGFPLVYEVMPGNTSDKTTLSDFLKLIEKQYGKANRTWVMDRGMPTEETLKAMREADPPVRYLVGAPKGRLTRLEKSFLAKPWGQAKESVQVKLLPREGQGNRAIFCNSLILRGLSSLMIQIARLPWREGDLYVLARGEGRAGKERSMRRGRLKQLWKRLKELQRQCSGRNDLLIKRQDLTPFFHGEKPHGLRCHKRYFSLAVGQWLYRCPTFDYPLMEMSGAK